MVTNQLLGNLKDKNTERMQLHSDMNSLKCLSRTLKGLKFSLKLLACQNLIDAGRRHVTSESETKGVITHNEASNVSFMFASGTLAHGGNVEHLRWTYHNKGAPSKGSPGLLQWS